MQKKKNSFITNLTTIFVGSIATKLISFLLVPFYTSILSTDEFGSVDIAITTASLLLPLFTGVIFEAVLRFSLDDNQDKKQVFSTGIYIDIVGVICFLSLSPLSLLYKPIKPYYFYFILYFISLVFNDTLLYFARGLNEIKKYTITSVIQTILLCVLNIIFLLVFKLGVKGYFLSYILSSLFSSIVIWLILRMDKYVIHPKQINRFVTKEMIEYSLPMIPNTISWWISNSSDRYFIIAICGLGINGIYAVSSKIPTVISLGTSIFNTAWQISAVENYGTAESKEHFSKMCFNYYSIVLFLGSSVILFTKILAKLLFQQSFFDAWVFVPILVVASCFHAFSTFIGSVFTTTKNTKYMSITTITGAVANIILNLVLITTYGPMGAASATLISYVIVYLMRYYYAKKTYPFSVDILNDVICFLLLVVQMIVVCGQFINPYTISTLILLAIVILRRKSLLEIARVSIGIVRRIRRKD